MALLRTLVRFVLAVVGWTFVLYPAMAVFGVFVLPPDPITQLLVFGPVVVTALLAATVFTYRSGSLRQLARFGIALFFVLVVLGFPINALFQVFGGFGTLLSVVVALVLVAVTYIVGYYLIYEDWYERVKSRYVGGATSQ